jgi:hypothetical protein
MKTQVLSVIRSKSFAFLVTALLSTQLSIAQNLPAHSSTAGCYGPLYDGSYALGAGPTNFELWPGSNNVQIQQANLDGTGGAVTSNAGGEWLYFQAVAAWVGSDRQWHEARGQWLASYNGFYQKVFRFQGGSWVALEPGGFDVSGHIIASQVALPGSGTYWFGANYSWGPIPGTTFQGYNSFQWVGTVRCG